MRLIDADALMEELEAWAEEADRRNAIINYAFATAIIAHVKSVPTIEERKGKWIEDAETYYKAVNEKGGGVDENTPYFTEDYIACSECLTMFSVIDNCTEDFDFCPNCGADMRKQP